MRKAKINSNSFQTEYYLSVEQGYYTEKLGFYILKLVDNVAYSGIIKHNGTNDVVEELKGFALMELLENLWKYHKVDKKSRAMYYAIAILKNSLRRMSKERLGANATKTLQGTDSFTLYYNGRQRKQKAVYVDIKNIQNDLFIKDDD